MTTLDLLTVLLSSAGWCFVLCKLIGSDRLAAEPSGTISSDGLEFFFRRSIHPC